LLAHGDDLSAVGRELAAQEHVHQIDLQL
jgi:hypothetical protein